jgi:hypothetical protein
MTPCLPPPGDIDHAVNIARSAFEVQLETAKALVLTVAMETPLLQCMSPELAPSGHLGMSDQVSLIGAKRNCYAQV